MEETVVALAGNPNVGKSTVFNALTGLRQHTGNWPGKTVAAARGDLTYGGERFTLVDLPGTYSLFPEAIFEERAAAVLEDWIEQLRGRTFIDNRIEQTRNRY